MISYSLISFLFALSPLLNNFIALPPAQSALMTSITLTDTLPAMDNGQSMGEMMPDMGQESTLATTAMTNTSSVELLAMLDTMNQMMNTLNQMMGERQNMTDTQMAGSPMAGMSGNMATGPMSADLTAMMSNMNEMMMMCMADMMNSNKKWYWIGGGALALILLGLLGWWLWRNRARFTPSDSPLLILQRRLARGEITMEQYEAVKVQLRTAAAVDKEL